MTELLGTRKRGDDWRFRGILVDEGEPDLSGDEWTIACTLKRPGSTPIVCTPDPAQLPYGRIQLTVAKALTADAAPGYWEGDIQIDGPNGRKTTDTFNVRVLPDVTT